MLRRFRRPTAALATALLLTSVAACGSDSTKDTAAAPAVKGVTFKGDVGKALTAKFTAKVALPKSTKTTTLVKGKGDKIGASDTVSTYLWVGNGTTKKEVFSDYKNGAPEAIPNSGQLPDVFQKLLKGATYGSRVVAVTNAKEVLGSDSGSTQLGIGAKDTVILVADFEKKVVASPTPSDDKAHDVDPSTQPKIVSKDGKPTGLDFTGIAEPDLTTPVQRVILKKGKGAAVKATDTISVNYLGETYKATTPFDESYSKGQPLSQPLSGLVKGWQIGLEGLPVGSRVLLQMPPAFGYDSQGSGSAIPGNATLWFVIDIVSAKAAG